MRFLRFLAAGFLLLASPALSQVTPGTSPMSVAKGGTGNGSAVSSGQVFVGQSGGVTAPKTLSGDVTNDNNGVTAIGANKVTNAKINPGAANTVKGSTNGTTTSDLAIASCSALYNFTQWVSGTGWQCGINPVLPSRAVAATLNLSAFSAITTLGYALPGDGGGAILKNIGSAAFIEQSVQTCGSIAGGATYTNGTYRGVPLTGGTGHNAIATIVVAGAVVTTVTITNWGGNAYTAGDVLSATAANIGGTGSGFSCTATVNAALGSFIDTGSTHWQLLTDSSGSNNVQQFGCKLDYQGVDGSSTDNTACLFAGLQHVANIPTPALTVDGGGSAGGVLVASSGSGLVCPSTKPFQIPSSVRFMGSDIWGTTWKLCNSFANSAQEIVDICDPGSHLSCFGSQIVNMTWYANTTPGAGANTPFVFSNSAQQMNSLYRVAIYSGNRGGLLYDTGFGGAAWFGIEGVEITPSGTANWGISYTNVGTTILKVKDSHVESGGGGITANGIQVTAGGILDVDGFHTEGISTGIMCNITGSTSSGGCRLHNLTGGVHCTNLVLRQAGSVASDVIVGFAFPNGCTNTVNNSGALTTTPVIADTLY